VGDEPLIDPKDPDAIIAVEPIGDEYGAGMIARTMRERFPIVKAP